MPVHAMDKETTDAYLKLFYVKNAFTVPINGFGSGSPYRVIDADVKALSEETENSLSSLHPANTLYPYSYEVTQTFLITMQTMTRMATRTEVFKIPRIIKDTSFYKQLR